MMAPSRILVFERTREYGLPGPIRIDMKLVELAIYLSVCLSEIGSWKVSASEFKAGSFRKVYTSAGTSHQAME